LFPRRHISYGLFTARNVTVTTVLLISALSLSGVIFIILEDEPSARNG